MTRTIGSGLLVVFVSCFLFARTLASVTPILPCNYQKVIGYGFATNWFKSIEPLSKYKTKNIQDVYDQGFTNLRLRCRADLHPANGGENFTTFLDNLEEVVDDCLETGVTPIISWINHDGEAFATDQDQLDYVAWWKAVAERLKDKDYRLGFNLFTELGVDGCGNNCSESLRVNHYKYNNWTSTVVKAIRETGFKNRKRILILGSPGKTAKDLNLIEKQIYEDDLYMMAEWHIYASGPNKRKGGQKYWAGEGNKYGRQNVDNAIAQAMKYTTENGLLTYLGAWMPQDNAQGKLKQSEVINFAKYFVKAMGKEHIPWSLNVLDVYYDTENAEWITGRQKIANRQLDMNMVLGAIKRAILLIEPTMSC